MLIKKHPITPGVETPFTVLELSPEAFFFYNDSGYLCFSNKGDTHRVDLHRQSTVVDMMKSLLDVFGLDIEIRVMCERKYTVVGKTENE